VILIVSFADNDHVDEVRRHLTRPHVVVDTAWFPQQLTVAAGTEGDRMRIRLHHPSRNEIDLSRVGAVWYRRIRPFVLHPEIVDEAGRLFAWSECHEAMAGIWYTLPCYWMNPPLGDEVAQRKIHQLRLAQQIGLAVPVTMITNDPAQAKLFVGDHGPGNVIRKAFRNIEQAPRQTAFVGVADLAALDGVRYAPVIFQRYVPAVADLRITIVDGEVFAAEIRSDADHQVDYRPGLHLARVRPAALPDTVADRLQQLMKLLNVSFGAIDMRLTPEGEYVFLEINPAGEYLFVSRRTGQPIPQAIAAALDRHDAEVAG
jgi:hypothetical protein